MKAIVKKLGKGIPRRWVDIHYEYEVIDGPFPCFLPGCEEVNSAFYIFVNDDHPHVQVYQHHSAALGGDGAEWELIDDDDCNDAYDRAMGVL